MLPWFSLIYTSWQTIHGKYKDTEISIFYYGYELLKPTKDFMNFQIASIEDICAMKLEAIAGRGLKRDFFDLYKIMELQGWDLNFLLSLNNEKYHRNGSFTPHVIRSLTYFDDAEKVSERSQAVEKEWPQIKEFFIEKVRDVSGLYFPTFKG